MKNPTSSSSSSSFSLSSGWTYDVFLSFKGEDTRFCFTGNLYHALCERGIKTFMDDEELRKGEEITPALIKAIQGSRIAIVVFSKNYASSSFCLEELVNIMECLNHKGRLVWPVFYQVDPSDVRHQKGSYAGALAHHEAKFVNKKKIETWRLALQQAANLSGSHFTHGRYEHEFIGKIIQELSQKINRIPLFVANYPVGLESRVQKVYSLLHVELNDGVQFVGIYGTGGMGKTTLACALYNYIADKFQNVSFLANIRENAVKHGLERLQETLLSKLVGEKNVELWNVNEGIPIIKSRLCQKKVLLILDDVDKLEQLKALANGLDCFGPGSVIIITTRDQHLLHVFGVERTYEVEALNHKEALEFVCWNAFKGKEFNPSHMDISQRIIHYCNGLPLSLEIISSDLLDRTVSECNSALDTYERIPHDHIQEILRVSYNSLKEFEKEIFLDIACCFKGYWLSNVRNILLNSRGFSPEYSIRVLIDKCLIRDDGGYVRMHNLIEDMGREIVRQESPLKPGKRSRLWFSEDILNVLEEDTGSDKIEIIKLCLDKDEEVQWDGSALNKMKNLKILIIENAHFSRGPTHLPKSLRVLKWRAYPDSSLPSNYDPNKLLMLDLPESFFTLELDNQQTMKFMLLTELKLGKCQSLKEVPDMSGAPNLKKLDVCGCENLVKIHDSVGFLCKLSSLIAARCPNLMTLPSAFNLPCLEMLSLHRCVNLKNFPEIIKMMDGITELNLSDSGTSELPFSVGNLIGLEGLNLNLDRWCWIYDLPVSVFMLPKLKVFGADSCYKFARLKKRKRQEQEKILLFGVELMVMNLTNENLTSLFHLFDKVRNLYLSCNNVTILPKCINAFCFLEILVLDSCKELREISCLPPKVKYFFAINCTSLTSQSEAVLLSQTMHESRKKGFILSGSSIPNWFDHCNRGPSISFWFHKKLFATTLCVVGVPGDFDSFTTFILSINGCKPLLFRGIPSLFPKWRTSSSSHIILCHLPLGEYDWENGWNHVEISCMGHYKPGKLINIRWMGVHVPRQDASLIDFRSH